VLSLPFVVPASPPRRRDYGLQVFALTDSACTLSIQYAETARVSRFAPVELRASKQFELANLVAVQCSQHAGARVRAE
jgi:hypothetical protein